MQTTTQIPTAPVGADVQLERLRRALQEGGRATVTVRSAKTKRHVTVDLVCRARGENGRFVSRATIAGRVGLADAHVIEARDPLREGRDSYVGSFYRSGSRWRASADADAARVWTADRVITAVLTGVPLVHEMLVADTCSACGKPLTDPVSIEAGMGPDCRGRATGSRVA